MVPLKVTAKYMGCGIIIGERGIYLNPGFDLGSRMYNQSKIEILRCLANGDWWATPDVAGECDLSLTNVSELLRRYRGQSLVMRRKRPDIPRGFLYRITDTGFERLRYLCSDELETSHVLGEAAGLTGSQKRIFDRWVREKLGGN
jgi:hypothetical protein